MVVREGEAYTICTVLDGETIVLQGSRDWSVWMSRVQNLSYGTIRTFTRSMDRFWQWSLFNPVRDDESFTFYLARFREDLRKGFVLEETIGDERFPDPVTVPILESRPLQKQSVNKELAGIRSFFVYNEMENLLNDQRYINYLYEHHKSKRGRLSSMDVRKGSWAMQHNGARVPFVAPYKQSRNRSKIKYFPTDLYDELLSVAKPRERLIYLLCGAAGARIGQALNLTLYDIDTEKKKVWLIDPSGDEYPEIQWTPKVPRRQWLLERYGIDMTQPNPHNTTDLQFKYPIPRMYGSLHWLAEDKYLAWFFETLDAYTRSREYISETVRNPTHPFLFVTKTGKRVHARDTLSRFKGNLQKLVDRRSAPSEVLGLGLHSLRHMFGHTMAELYAATGNEAILPITQNAMGHVSVDSTLVYFNLSEESLKKVIAQAHMEVHHQGRLA